jgi:hypothetical protein
MTGINELSGRTIELLALDLRCGIALEAYVGENFGELAE